MLLNLAWKTRHRHNISKLFWHEIFTLDFAENNLCIGLARYVAGESPNYLKPVMMVTLFRETVLKVYTYSPNML